MGSLLKPLNQKDSGLEYSFIESREISFNNLVWLFSSKSHSNNSSKQPKLQPLITNFRSQTSKSPIEQNGNLSSLIHSQF